MMYVPLHPKFDIEHLGFLPGFLDDEDPDPAQVQLDKHYQHGGGYRPMQNWSLDIADGMTIQYPGDRPLKPIAYTMLHDKELVFFYPHAFVLIIQKDQTWVIARMD